MNIEVLFEDADLLAVNKPAGVLSVPDRWDKSKDNLIELLQAERPGQYFAKNTDAFRRVARQLRERETRKLCLALVHGDIDCRATAPVADVSRTASEALLLTASDTALLYFVRCRYSVGFAVSVRRRCSSRWRFNALR